MKWILLVLGLSTTIGVSAQSFVYKGQRFTGKNVTCGVAVFQGDSVIKVQRDLNQLGFDAKKLEATVDEPTYVKLDGVEFKNGTIELEVYSTIMNPSPFEFAQGFIGVAFRIAPTDSAFESIYLRPRVGRSNDQFARNRAIQYYAYPRFKFETLRKMKEGKYEGNAPVNVNEWIKLRLVVNGAQAELFVNDAPYSNFIVDKMLGTTTSGAVALWVDIGTIGYFKNVRILLNQ